MVVAHRRQCGETLKVKYFREVILQVTNKPADAPLVVRRYAAADRLLAGYLANDTFDNSRHDFVDLSPFRSARE